MGIPVEERKQWINATDLKLSVEEKITLSSISKTAYYYKPVSETPENLLLMEQIDRLYTEHPYYGSRKMVFVLNSLGWLINRKRVRRLMNLMGLEAIYPKPNLSKPSSKNKKYPYLLRGVKITVPNQVWSTDITYIPLRGGFLYLTAILDWYSRYVLAWRLSNTLDVGFCLEALDEALNQGKPVIFNTDQGAQFTSQEFTKVLEKQGIQISMDGRGRALDNVFVERLWRTIKYENVYIKKYENGVEAKKGLKEYLTFYNDKRIHQSLNYKTPRELYKSIKAGKEGKF